MTQVADAGLGRCALAFDAALFACQIGQFPFAVLKFFLQRAALAIARLLGPAHIGDAGLELFNALASFLCFIGQCWWHKERAKE